MTFILIIICLKLVERLLICTVKMNDICNRLYEEGNKCSRTHIPEICLIARLVGFQKHEGHQCGNKKSWDKKPLPFMLFMLQQGYHRIGNDRRREMHDNINGQHKEHIPVLDFRLAILTHRIEHHKAADQKTDHQRNLGIGKLHAIVRMWYLYEHQ